ncbi:MAG: prolipoprotein diacylglyceryl transferase [Desulfarculales bacterium]|jgi:phosphatidylglycerol:prolipoprotein diacylglycerol transferase|nr:prolipoprotein diacylglyceryl transferase [Desulfarculales bacterium]
MHPVLMTLGSFTLYSYGLMLALGVLAGTVLNCALARSNGLGKEQIQSAVLWIMVCALLGTRIFYVLINLPEFAADPVRMLYIWEGGMVFYGGLIGGIAAALFLARRWKISVLRLFDNLAPGLALGQALGRVGCFLAGCCYGIPYQGWGAVVFTDPHSLAPRNLSLFPSQLFEAGAMLLITAALLAFWKKRGVRAGRVACLFGILAGLERIAAEQLRGDFRGAAWGNDFFTPTIIIAIIMVLLSAWGWMAFKGKSLKR